LDADILIDLAPENVHKLLVCLRAWGEGWGRESHPEDFVPQEGSIRVMEDFDLDIFTQMRGYSLEFFRPRLQQLKVGEAVLRYLSPADLILLNQGSWREKDKLDVLAMQEIIARKSGTK
jgi:hypothetical protein